MTSRLSGNVGWVALAVGVAAVVLSAAPVRGKLTPAEKCAATKLKATAKKIRAKIKCYRRAKLGPADPTCLQKAEDKFAKAFAKAEKPGACLDPGDADAVETQVDALVNALLQALQPAARQTAQQCADAKFAAASTYANALVDCTRRYCLSASTCSQSALDSCKQQARTALSDAFTRAEAAGGCFTVGDASKIQGIVDKNVASIGTTITPQTFLPTPTPAPFVRFIDNGNGTISDRATHLVWEKKDDAGGIHDQDNTYTWSNSGTAPDGTVFTAFLATLNTPPCFAGYCDWRLPTSAGDSFNPTGQAAQLESIVDLSVAGCPTYENDAPCVAAPFNTNCTPGCSLTRCSCTASAWYYWSGSTNSGFPTNAWFVYFDYGEVYDLGKTNGAFVRAVRP